MNTAEDKWYCNFIFIKSGNGIEKVNTKEIFVVERNGRKLTVVTEEMTYSYYDRIQNVEPSLSSNFIKCHTGCFINLHKIKSIKNQTIVMDNGYVVVLGKNNFTKVKQYYRAYIQNLTKI